MNTVGRPGKLGADIRCVVSVSMLTEGWDANTVTHILGVRAFGTQLLCEQVVGRGLRRISYEIDPATGFFPVEYADVLGVPFTFAQQGQNVTPKAPPKVTRVLPERAACEIRFPNVAGYRIVFPRKPLRAVFTQDSKMLLTPIIPPVTEVEPLIGQGFTLDLRQHADQLRLKTVVFDVAGLILREKFRDAEGQRNFGVNLQTLSRSRNSGLPNACDARERRGLNFSNGARLRFMLSRKSIALSSHRFKGRRTAHTARCCRSSMPTTRKARRAMLISIRRRRRCFLRVPTSATSISSSVTRIGSWASPNAWKQ